MAEYDPLRGVLGGRARPLGQIIRPGSDDEILKWADCPDCGGVGYFVVNPFADAYTHRQCETCETAHRAYASISATIAGLQENGNG